MFDALETIRTAAQLLVVQEPSTTDRLPHARDVIWQRMYESSHWPPALQERVRTLAGKLTAKGNIETTISRMSPDEAEALAREIVQLATDIQAIQQPTVH